MSFSSVFSCEILSRLIVVLFTLCVIFTVGFFGLKSISSRISCLMR